MESKILEQPIFEVMWALSGSSPPPALAWPLQLMLGHQLSICVTFPSSSPFFHLCSYPLTLFTSYFSCPLFLEMPRQPGISFLWAVHHKGGQVKLFYSSSEVQVLRHLILNFPAVCCGLSTGTEFRSTLPLPPI